MTPAELDDYINRRRAARGLPPLPPTQGASAAPAPTAPKIRTPDEALRSRAASAETAAVADLRSAEDRLRVEMRQRLMAEGKSVVEADFEDEVEALMEEHRQPPHIGSFSGALTPYSSPLSLAPAPSTAPVNVPSGELSLSDVVRPQTKVPDVVAIQAEEDPFDGVAFERSIAGLDEPAKRERRASFQGYRTAYARLRDLNPDVTTDRILADLDRQLKGLPDALQGKGTTRTQDPRTDLGIAGDPISVALSRQTTAGVTPMLEPGQLAFLEGVYGAELPLQQSEDRALLSAKGAKVLTKKLRRPSGDVGPGGRPIMEEHEVEIGRAEHTPEEIDSIISGKTQRGEYDARPWWADEAERQRILSQPEGSAKGGFLFQKEYMTGATVESPVSWTVRSAMLVPNALAGAIGYSFTPEGTQLAKEDDRPEKFRQGGLGANVLYNVATSGGYTREIGDLYKYSPDPTLRKYEVVGQLAGFGLDLLGLGDINLVSGAVAAPVAATQFARAASAAGLGGVGAARAGATAGARAAASAWIDAAPFLSRLAKDWAPGDVRFIYGARLGDEFQAGSRYIAAHDRSIAAGGSAAEAHESALRLIREELGATKVSEDLGRLGPDEAYSTMKSEAYWKKGLAEFNHSDAVARATQELEDAAARGVTPSPGAERAVKPYLQAAAKADKRIASAIAGAFADAPKGAKVSAADVFRRLSPLGRDSLGRAIRSVSSFEQGAKVMDTQLAGSLSRGAPTVALTPRTMVSTKGADAVVRAYKDSPFFTRVVSLLQRSEPISIASGTRAVDGHKVQGPEVVGRIRQALSAARSSGALGAADEARILRNLDQGAISVDDLRMLSYSEVDAIAAAKKLGITSSSLAEVGRAPKTVPAPSGRARTIAQERRLGELRSSLPVAVRRSLDSMRQTWSSIEGQITSVQRKMIDDAKGKVSALDRVLRDDMGRISSDEEFAALYGTTVDAPSSEKLIALGQGVRGGGGGRIYAEQFLEGLIYGTKQNKLVRAVMPSYMYGEAVLRNDTEWNKLVDAIKDMTPAELDAALPSIFERAKEIVRTSINTSITDRGGRVLSVPPSLTLESLAVAYARVKANEIVAEAAAKLLPERPIDLSADGSFVVALGGRTKLGEKIYYSLVKEVVRNEKLLSQLADGSVPIRPLIERIIAESDPNSVRGVTHGALRGYLERELTDPNSSLADDLMEQIDIMRDYGMIESRKTEEFVDRLGDLVRGKISPNNLILPAVAEELQRMLGSEAKYEQLVRELSSLSDLAADGSRSAIGAVRAVRGLIDSYSAFYYYGMLSLSPRFHGVNNLTAPIITYYTTGRVANPLRSGTAANVLLLGSPAARGKVGRNVVVVTDSLGNTYTRGQLFDMAMKGGIFKSQINTEVAGNFIEEANVILGNISRLSRARRAVFTGPREVLGDPIAAFTDNVWRMESMIAAIKGGKSVEEALDVGRLSLFDYGQLTAAERFVARNFFVFYNYFRQSVVQGMTNLLANPGRMIRLLRATTQPSRILIGEESYQDLSFYFPPDAATGRIVSAIDPSAMSKEGTLNQLPMMPHSDALKIAGAALTDPVAWFVGPAPLTGEGRRDVGEGVILSKLGPITKGAARGLATDSPLSNLLSIRMKKNRIAPEHIAVWETVLPKAVLTDILTYLDVEVRDAPVDGGENSYQGKIYVVDDDRFADYTAMLNAFTATGTIRSWNDWSKIIGGVELKGAYAETKAERVQSFFGAQTYGSTALETVTSERYLRDRARMLDEERNKLEGSRSPGGKGR